MGLWAGEGGEGAKYWHHVLTEIKNRGVADVCIVVCDGLTGLPDAVSLGVATFDRADLRDPFGGTGAYAAVGVGGAGGLAGRASLGAAR